LFILLFIFIDNLNEIEKLAKLEHAHRYQVNPLSLNDFCLSEKKF
jgi:hypothetical protein